MQPYLEIDVRDDDETLLNVVGDYGGHNAKEFVQIGCHCIELYLYNLNPPELWNRGEYTARSQLHMRSDNGD